MPILFATGFDRPVLADGYPLTLVLAIGPAVRQQLYFERLYRGSAGEQLAIRATLISQRGMVLLHDLGPWPVGCAGIEATVTNLNRATEPDPVREEVAPVQEPAKFATPLQMPVVHDGNPLHLSIGIGSTRQVVYLERVYLDTGRRQIAIRSDVVHERGLLEGFNIHLPEPFPGTRYINVSVSSEYRATEPAQTLEYESLEFNDLEYN